MDGAPRGSAARFNRWLLIGAAVAFVVLLGERAVSLVRDDAPASAPDTEDPGVPMPGANTVAGSGPVRATAPTAPDVPSVPVTDAAPTPPSLDTLFGSRIVLASAIPPGYLVTQDRRRHDAGATLGAGYRLEAVSLDAIVVERDGRRIRVDLDGPADGAGVRAPVFAGDADG